jgi:hypothetical protein
VGLDRVAVATPRALARDVADRGALGDADRLADVAQTDARVGRDAQQDTGVVGKKRPSWRSVAVHYIPDYYFYI